MSAAMLLRIEGCRSVAAGFLVLANVTVSRGQDSLSHTVGISAGMGITVIRATDIVDYINAATASNPRLDDFTSTAEFFGATEVRLGESWGVKLEYAYLFKSYTVSQGAFGAFDYFYAVHMPTLMAQYLDVHPGYAFKVGGGIGYHVANFSEQLQGASRREFRSSGVGAKLEGEGNTALGERLFAYLAGDLRFDFMSAFRDSQGNALRARGGAAGDARMNFLALGLKFGLVYYF